jgi:hypothetical protein
MKTMNVVEVLGKNYIHGLYASENSEEVKKHFEIIAAVNKELFKQIPYEIVFTEEDMYSSAKEMREKVQETGIMYIYTGWSGHPFLTQEQNNIGRAVHDVFAHCVCGCPFNFQGELNAYYEQRKYYPKEVWATLFAEIPMQTAAFYAAGKEFSFPQRAIKATEQDMLLVSHMVKDYSKNSILKPLQTV